MTLLIQLQASVLTQAEIVMQGSAYLEENVMETCRSLYIYIYIYIYICIIYIYIIIYR